MVWSLFLEVGFPFFDLNIFELGRWPTIVGTSGGVVWIAAVGRGRAGVQGWWGCYLPCTGSASLVFNLKGSAVVAEVYRGEKAS